MRFANWHSAAAAQKSHPIALPGRRDAIEGTDGRESLKRDERGCNGGAVGRRVAELMLLGRGDQNGGRDAKGGSEDP